MNFTVYRTEDSVFAQVPRGNCPSYERSENVRQWLVLRALDTHRAGHYVADRRELDAAFNRVVDDVRSRRITLDYQPRTLVTFCLPSLDDPLYLQALVHWCAQLKCSSHILVEAHSTVGNNVPLKCLFAAVTKLKRAQPKIIRWEKTIFKVTMTPSTVPMGLA